MAGTLRCYFYPRLGGLQRGGVGGISCISPLLSKQHVCLWFGLVSLALKSCSLGSAHNGILRVPVDSSGVGFPTYQTDWRVSHSPTTPQTHVQFGQHTGRHIGLLLREDTYSVCVLSCLLDIFSLND